MREADASVVRQRIGRGTRLVTAVLIGFAVAVLTACGDDDEVAEDIDRDQNTTPTALAGLPEGIAAVEVAIAGGAFAADDFVVQEGEPTVLRIANADPTAYRLRIGDLVAPTAIAASGGTEVELTTPNAGTYDIELLAAESDEVIATAQLIVQAPGGIEEP
jgi:hypothetical protein